MRTSLLALILTAGTLPISAQTADTSLLAKVHTYLTMNQEGKPLTSPKTAYVIEANKLVADSTSTRKIQDVVLDEEADRLDFNIAVTREQTVYKLDKDGQRIQPGETHTYDNLKRCILSQRKSAPVVMGICYIKGKVSNESRVEVSFDVDGNMNVHEETATDFTDGYSVDGYKPIVLVHDHKISTKDGVVTLETTESGYDYNVTTRSRSLTPYATVKVIHKSSN